MEIDCVSADESPSPQGGNQEVVVGRSKTTKDKWKSGRKTKSQSENTQGHIDDENIAHKKFFQGEDFAPFR